MKGILKKAVIAALSLSMMLTVVAPTSVFAKAKTHNVTFVYGTKMIVQQVKHGKNAVLPIDTAVPGYAFSGWVGNAMNVTEDRVILGAYNKDTYTMTATADSNVYISKYGLPVFQPQPTVRINSNKTAPEPEWWKTINIPRGVPGKTCAVHFYNGWNGEYWKTVMVPYGASCPDPGNPCLDGFEFVGWEGDWTNVTEDRCIKAWYFVYHRVTIIDSVTNDVMDVQRIRTGGDIRTGNEPFHEGWAFDHYEGQTTNITSDTTVRAVYKH